MHNMVWSNLLQVCRFQDSRNLHLGRMHLSLSAVLPGHHQSVQGLFSFMLVDIMHLMLPGDSCCSAVSSAWGRWNLDGS